MNRYKNKIYAVALSALLVSAVFLAPMAVSAQITDNLNDVPGRVFTVEMLFNILRKLACYFIRFGIIAVGIMMVVYGLMFLKSRGSPAGMSEAKKALTWGIIGGLVIMGVFTIILTVSSLVGYGASNYTEYPILTKIMTNCL